MGNNQTSGGNNTLKRHIETATKTGVLQYDSKKLKEVRLTSNEKLFEFISQIRSVLVFVCLVYEHYR